MCFSKEGSQARDQYVENISSFFIDVINNITEKYAQEKEEHRQGLYASMEIKRVDSLDINKNEKKVNVWSVINNFNYIEKLLK